MAERTPGELGKLIYDTASKAEPGTLLSNGEQYRLTAKTLIVRRDISGLDAVRLRVDAWYRDDTGQPTDGRARIQPIIQPIPGILEREITTGVDGQETVFDTPNRVAALALEYFNISLDGITEFNRLTDSSVSLYELQELSGAYDVRRLYYAKKELRSGFGQAALTVCAAEMFNNESGYAFTGTDPTETPLVLLERSIGYDRASITHGLQITQGNFLHIYPSNQAEQDVAEAQRQLGPAIALNEGSIAPETWGQLIESPLQLADVLGSVKE